jgi:hypothetical protein
VAGQFELVAGSPAGCRQMIDVFTVQKLSCGHDHHREQL